MTRTALAALLALCVLAPVLAGDGSRESLEDANEPPKMFPDNKAESFSRGRMPTAKTPTEATDMRNNPNNDTELVHHPKVKDPGTTHAEGSEPGRGSIHACTLPSFRDGGPNARASDWLADSGNVTKVCHLPVEWLNGNASTLRVCSIPRDAWNSSYTFSDGTIPKELLAELVNTTNVKCVAPREALSNSSAAANDTITSGSIPSAWLRDNDDNIYIYIIPQEWLRESKPAAGKASEVEDLTSESTDVVTPTSGPVPSAASAAAGAVAAAAATPAAEPGSAANASLEAPSNATGVDNATAMTSLSNSSGTEPTPSGNLDVGSSTIAPASGATATNDTNTPTSAVPVAGEAAAANDMTSDKPKEQTAKTTEKPREETTVRKEETTQTTPKPKDETTKATDTPAVAPVVTTAATQKSEEKPTEATKEATTRTPKVEKPDEHHSDAENEIAHGGVSPPPPAALSQQHSDHNHAASASGKTAFLQPTESAAILAGVFVAIALLGYAGLLLWRRVLEKRYGNREMLVNEDDDFDTSDMRHFEL